MVCYSSSSDVHLENAMPLMRGDHAPNFTLPTDTETTWFTLSDWRGKCVILYFYPKNNTPGCTKEACDFRDYFGRFKEKNIQIVGISKDTPRSHTRFKQKHALPF